MNTAIGIRFVAGRYHALPWSRHVNEAVVEWPPSPVRLLRALIAVWHRKGDAARHPENRLEELIYALARTKPVYVLPHARLGHSRHFMPISQNKKEDRTLVFDAFLRINRDDELVMAWPDVALSSELRALLVHLLTGMSYLGRAESWVACRFLEDWEGEPNSIPEEALDQWGYSASRFERVQLEVPLPPDQYSVWLQEQQQELANTKKGRATSNVKLLQTLPPRLLDALRLDTGEWREAGWSHPPGISTAVWCRPLDAFSPVRTSRKPRGLEHRMPTTVRFILLRALQRSDQGERLGPPLPLFTDSIKIGEAIRAAAIAGQDDPPPALSGHDLPWSEPHQHAFYLPEDADGDGRIDHILVHVPAGLDNTAFRSLTRIQRLWVDSGSEWRVVLERFGFIRDFPEHPYLRPSSIWESVTPYLHPWHLKKSFLVADQLARELELRGYPQPRLEQLPSIPVGNKFRRSVHFHRFRSRATSGSLQPDTQGSFWRLTFQEPQAGPIALGFGCHFGLGLFRAVGL